MSSCAHWKSGNSSREKSSSMYCTYLQFNAVYTVPLNKFTIIDIYFLFGNFQKNLTSLFKRPMSKRQSLWTPKNHLVNTTFCQHGFRHRLQFLRRTVVVHDPRKVLLQKVTGLPQVPLKIYIHKRRFSFCQANLFINK